MSIVHTLLGARPPARSDGTAWNRVRVEHADKDSGPWVTDATVSLDPVDADPGNPRRRDFTFTSSAAEAFFRLTFLDEADNESTPTDPIFDDGSGVDWRPTVAEVASLLRARTYSGQTGEKTGGALVGTFDDTTRPTGQQVAELIQQAVNEVRTRVGRSIPDAQVHFAKSVTALRAAMGVEISYLPNEQKERSDAVYEKLKELYESGLQSLIAALPDSMQTAKGIYSIPMVSDVVPPLEPFA